MHVEIRATHLPGLYTAMCMIKIALLCFSVANPGPRPQPVFSLKSREKSIDPAAANTLRFARTLACIPMTSLFRNALPLANQSAHSPFAYLLRSRTSS